MSPETVVREFETFWLLVKKADRRDDVARVYLAIQSALAHGLDHLNVGELVGALMPEGCRTPDAGTDAIDASGLAYFHWLFEVELVATGPADGHRYRFRRRHDRAEILAELRTAPDPKSLRFQQEYDRQLRKLTAKRTALHAAYSRRPHGRPMNEPGRP